VRIGTDQTRSAAARLQIVDAQGRVVGQFRIEASSELRMPTSALATGLYTLELVDGPVLARSRMLVQH
jgi:hypothetical protein